MGSNRSKDNGRQRKGLAGLRNLRTATRARLRSKPQAEGQEYLDMYVLARERTRWARSKARCEEALEEIQRAMKKIEKTLQALEHTEDEDQEPEPRRERSRKGFGTFRVDY